MSFLAWPLALIAIVYPASVLAGPQSDASLAFVQAFRDSEPFLEQTIVVSEPGEEGNRTFLLTEPPAAAFAERDAWLADVFGSRMITTSVLEHPIGFDGFVRDIVVETEAMTESEVAETVAQLHEEFFGTRYKAFYRTFVPKSWNTARPATRREGPPNVEISASSLHNWLYGESAVRFSSDVLDAKGPKVADAFVESIRTDAFGVYYSDPAGLVLLVIPRKSLLNDVVPILRRFVVDTDAILGAVTSAGADWLVLVGRERTTPPDEMEPLRIDTLLTLASSGQTDLAQSYQRTAPLAGKVADLILMSALHGLDAISFSGAVQDLPPDDHGRLRFTSEDDIALTNYFGVDWAPILLSRELTHTEYGQLLNITDQMLKSWSSGNTIDYARFYYPKPFGNPDAEGLFARLQSEVGNFNQLTFNWNTAGFGTWTDFGTTRIFTLFRTGALPVAYFPEAAELKLDRVGEAAVEKAEDDYWSFFANLRNPYLTRAAQYAALHVIFTAVPVTAVRTEPLVSEEDYDKRWNGLADVVAGAVSGMSADLAASPGSAYDAELPGFLLGVESGCITASEELDLLRSGPQAPMAKAVLQQASPEDLSRWLIDPGGADAKFRAEDQELRERSEQLDQDIGSYNLRAAACDSQYDALQCTDSVLGSQRANLESRNASFERDDTRFADQYAAFLEANSVSEPLIRPLSAFGDCSHAWQAVVDEAPPTGGSVFHTPGIVVSDGAGNIFGTGGHNLDGRSVEVLSDTAVPVGKVRIDAEAGIIRLNPEDVSSGASAGRAFERDFKRFEAGDAAFQERVLRQVEAALVQDKRAVQAFDAVAQARPAEALPGERGLVFSTIARTGPVRSVGPRAVRLDDVTARDLASFAARSHGQGVIRRLPDGRIELSLPDGRPPIAILSDTRESLQSAAEEMVSYAARTGGETSGVIRFVDYDGTMSIGDMAAIKYSAVGRPSAGVGGSGGGLPPGGVRGILFDSSEPPRRIGGGGKGGGFDGDPPSVGGEGSRFERLMVGVFGRKGDPLAKLTRVDADWTGATIDSVKIDGFAGKSDALTATLSIPFKTKASSGLRARLSALFERRKPTQGDAEALVNAVNSVRANPGDLQLWQQLELIRIEFQSAIADGHNTVLHWHLQDSVDDFYVVEDETPKASHRG